MSLGTAALAGAVLAAAVSALLTELATLSGPVDPVKARSSHARPTPTSGGLAMMAGAAAGLALLAALAGADPQLSPRSGGFESVGLLLGAAAAVGLFGAADDLLDLDPRLKLAAQLAFALFVAVAGARVETLPGPFGTKLELGPILGAAGSALFLLVLLNAANFMDGCNGLLAGVSAIALLGLAAAGLPAFVLGAPSNPAVAGGAALAVAGAVAGFAPWNIAGRVFQGDVGAFFAAAAIGGLGLLLAQSGTASPYLVVMAVLPLLVDVLLTLIVRARRRERLLEAHREHLYQLWLQATGRSHLALAWRVWALTGLTTGAGLLLEAVAPGLTSVGLAAATGLLSLGWVRLRARLSASLPRTAAGDGPTAGRPAGAAGTGTRPSR